VIKALGFEAEDLPRLFGSEGLGVTRWGTRTDGKTMMTLGRRVRGTSCAVPASLSGRSDDDDQPGRSACIPPAGDIVLPIRRGAVSLVRLGALGLGIRDGS
jgi:hypothetical protein